MQKTDWTIYSSFLVWSGLICFDIFLFRWNAWWSTRTTRRRPLRTTSRSSNWKTRSRDNPTLSPFVCQGGRLIKILTISMTSSHFHSYSTSSSHAAISIFVGVITVCFFLGITTRSSWTQWELSPDGDDLNMVGDQVNIKVEILINSYDLSVNADFVNYVQEVAFRTSFTKSRCQLSTMTAAKTCSPLRVSNHWFGLWVYRKELVNIVNISKA